MTIHRKKTLVAGWFSFELMGATAGDLLARDVACDWLRRAGHDFDIALAAPFSGGVDWRQVDPADYAHVLFVCGPLGNGEPVSEFLERFARCRTIGLNLTMLHRLEDWNPFEVLFERDSTATARPDLAFLSSAPRVPVVGVVLVHPQAEYKKRARHQLVHDAIQRLIATRELAAVPIDTRLDVNKTGLRTPAEIESLIARMDIVVTTRLHGAVLALKNGVPVVAVDPVERGAKIVKQCGAIGWPVVFTPETLTSEALDQAFEYCSTAAARDQAQECRRRAIGWLQRTRDEFLSELAAPAADETSPGGPGDEMACTA